MQGPRLKQLLSIPAAGLQMQEQQETRSLEGLALQYVGWLRAGQAFNQVAVQVRILKRGLID